MRTAFFLIALASSTLIFAQEQQQRKFKLGISVSAGQSGVNQKALLGGPGILAKRSFEIGLHYYLPLTGKLMFESGIHWHANKIEVTPGVYPGIDRSPTYYNVNLLYVPLLARVNITKNFFVNAGVLADWDISAKEYINNQSGIGAGFGLGAIIPISQKLAVQITPYMNVHGLLTYNSQKYHQSLFDSGIRLGLLLR